MRAMSVCSYPLSPHQRKHGPQGYKSYRSYKPWLRDEFTFKCVYCLVRESCYGNDDVFGADHLIPQSTDSSQENNYDNLVYACNFCNSNKRFLSLIDPCQEALGSHLKVREDGRIEPITLMGRKILSLLQLNDEYYVKFRKRIIKTRKLLDKNPEKFKEPGEAGDLLREYLDLLRYPKNLPDLSAVNPPGGNSRKDGVETCFFLEREKKCWMSTINKSFQHPFLKTPL